MKVIILAGGKGTRLLPLTEDKPKPMVEVMSKPLLEWIIGKLEDCGIGNIGIVTGYKSEKIEEYVKQNNISDITLIHQTEQLGTGHALSLCEDFIGKDNFLLINGDSIFCEDDIVSLMNTTHKTVVSGMYSDHPNDYGVLFTSGNMLLDIVEKPDKHIGNFVNVGLYKFSPKIFYALNKITPSNRGELELPDAIKYLIKHDVVYLNKIKHYWLELSKPEDVSKIEKHFQ